MNAALWLAFVCIATAIVVAVICFVIYRDPKRPHDKERQ